MFSICVATIRPNTLLATINAIRQQTWKDWELIVVGQGNNQELAQTAERLEQIDSRIRYIHLTQKGLSLARNAGIKAARGEWIAMTDDDCEPATDWLAIIAEYFQSGQDIGLVGGSLITPPRPKGKIGFCPGGEPSEAIYDPAATPNRPPRGWDWLGGNFAMTRNLVECVGLFDEHLGAGANFPAGEDTDYKLRVEALGIKMASTPRAVVRHTYGWRFGIQATIRHLSAYSRGNGGLAGKLTLLSDKRGKEWLDKERRIFKQRLLKLHQFYRLPIAINRLNHFSKGYHDCVSGYQIDPHTGMLMPNVASPVLANS